MAEESLDIAWQGNLREISTHWGRFRRGIYVRVRREDAIRLMSSYPGFQIKGMEDGAFISLMAKEGKKLAVIRNRGAGDVISCAYFLALPLFRAHPNTTVDFYCDLQYVSLVKQFPFLDRVFGEVGNLSKYDAFVDMCWVPERKDPRNKRVRPEIFAEAASDLANFQFDFLELPKDLTSKAIRSFNEKGRDWNRNLIGIQMTSASPVRVYPIAYTRKLVEFLIREGFEVALFGEDHWHYGLAQWNGDHLLNFIDKTATLLECAGLISKCDFFIAPDSGLLHLASILGVYTLGLFGNIRPENRIKYYPRTEALFPDGELDCIPCGDIYNPCPECSNLAGTHRSGRCMQLLVPERVLESFLDFAERTKGVMRKESEIKNLCPFCRSKGKRINLIQGKWFKEYYPDRVIFFQCLRCKSIFCNPNLETVSYEEEYWTEEPGKFSGDYFTDTKKSYFYEMSERVKNLFREGN